MWRFARRAGPSSVVPCQRAHTIVIITLQESPGDNSQTDESSFAGTLPKGPAENKYIQLLGAEG